MGMGEVENEMVGAVRSEICSFSHTRLLTLDMDETLSIVSGMFRRVLGLFLSAIPPNVQGLNTQSR